MSSNPCHDTNTPVFTHKDAEMSILVDAEMSNTHKDDVVAVSPSNIEPEIDSTRKTHLKGSLKKVLAKKRKPTNNSKGQGNKIEIHNLMLKKKN